MTTPGGLQFVSRLGVVTFVSLGFGVTGALLGLYVGIGLDDSQKSDAAQAHPYFVPPIEVILWPGVGLAIGILVGAGLGLAIVHTIGRGGGGRVFQVLLELVLAWSGSALGVLFMFVGAYAGLASGLFLAHGLTRDKGTPRAILLGTVVGSVVAALGAWSLPWSWYGALDIVGNMESSLALAFAVVLPIPIAVAFYERSKGTSATT